MNAPIEHFQNSSLPLELQYLLDQPQAQGKRFKTFEHSEKKVLIATARQWLKSEGLTLDCAIWRYVFQASLEPKCLVLEVPATFSPQP